MQCMDFVIYHELGQISSDSQQIKLNELKGLAIDFFWSGTSINHFQKQGKIHINQKKLLNPHKIAEIMKKTRFLASFILRGTLSSVFQFPKMLVILCEGCLKEKKYDF